MIKIELTFTKGKITRQFSGDYEVTLIVSKDQEHNMEPLNELLSDEKVKTCKIGHKKKRRSLNANSYAWLLITEIANKLRSSKEEIYLQMLKRYGQSSVVSIIDEAVPVFMKSVKYAEEFGKGMTNGKEFTHIKVYMGSSEMDSKQFSILLDGIVSECELLSIPTLEDLEIRRLIEEWGK
ncbi:MAG: hypothetical protein WAP07_00850 [Acutalibacteraceae bacterium]